MNRHRPAPAGRLPGRREQTPRYNPPAACLSTLGGDCNLPYSLGGTSRRQFLFTGLCPGHDRLALRM